MIKPFALLGLWIGLLVIISASSLAPVVLAASAAPKVLTYADGTDITTLDGAFITDLPSSSLLKLVFNSLVSLTADMGIEPDLAESWTVADDKITWIFKLRQGPKFSNGKPVTAEAVKFSLERIIDEKTVSPNRSALAQLKAVAVVDNHTVQIITKQPFPDLLPALADRTGMIMDPAEVAKYPVREVGRHPVGSGPYQVREWIPGQQVVLERNPQWWGSSLAIDRIVYRVVPEANTRLAMVQRGEADIIARPPVEALPALEKDPGLKVLKVDGILTITLEMLTDKKPLDDPRVRKAIAHAIDRKAIIEGLLQGLASEHCSTVGPGVGREFLTQQPCYEYNPQKAKELLTQADYPDGFTIDLWIPQGRYTKDREIGEAVQAMLGEVGITVNLQTWEWATYRQKWAAPDRTMWMIGRATGFTDFIFTRQFSKAMWDSGANNNTRFYDPQVEELLVKARQEMDVKQRAVYYRQIQEITWQALPILPIHTQKIVLVTRSNISGLTIIPNEEVILSTVRKD
jgi:peptide/nickel transport system substrate-binding protein